MSGFPFQKTDLFVPFRLGRTARETLQEFIDIDVTAGDLVRILNANQAYRDLFFRFVSQKTARPDRPRARVVAKDGAAEVVTDEKAEPPKPTHRLINLLGMLGSRNLIVALRMHRSVEGRFPVTPEGDVELKPGDSLHYALEAEELFSRNKLEYSETAHAAGVYFDFCVLLYGRDGGLKKLEPYVKRVWTRALRTGLVAYSLAERIPGFNPRTAAAAGMLAPAGKLHLAVHFSGANYAELEESWDKASALPVLATLLLERKKFGCAAEDVVAHSLYYFDVFRELREPVACYREPYNLLGQDPGHHRLAVLLNLANNMARTWKLPGDEKDPVFTEWSYPGLSALKVKRATLIAAMKRAMTLR